MEEETVPQLQQNQLTDKKLLTLLGILIVVGILVGSYLGRVFIYKKTVVEKPSKTQPTKLIPSLTPSLTVTPTIVKEAVSVQFSKREKIFETVKIAGRYNDEPITPGVINEHDMYVLDFYKIGTIVSGKYSGGDLVLSSVLYKGACKGVGCGQPFRFRFIIKDSTAVYLPNISPDIAGSYHTQKVFMEADMLQKFGYTFITDQSLTIPILEVPKEIIGENPRQILQTGRFLEGGEEDGFIDNTRLYKVFTHATYGDIYTTRPEFSPQISFGSDYKGFGSETSVGECEGKNCFVTNMFFAFRPDGTYFKLGYQPDFEVKEIAWTTSDTVGEEYKFNTIESCSHNNLDQISILSPALVSDNDLSPIGKLNSTDEQIFALSNQNHSLYTEFYSNYKTYLARPDVSPENKITPKTYAEFIKSVPIFIWQDPFGRRVVYRNMAFLPPNMCEPIIYLYPTTKQNISITLDDVIHISDSAPEYNNGWHVVADPSGHILDRPSGISYPYLFWEGWSYIFPVQSRGFVVQKNNVEDFLIGAVSKLGLQGREKDDFMDAWLPYFDAFPYYFITFIDQQIIDRIAPIHISPKPDTVIRILMDVKPLEQPISVMPLELKSPPKRTGFTVVEWGGLKR